MMNPKGARINTRLVKIERKGGTINNRKIYMQGMITVHLTKMIETLKNLYFYL